MIRAMLLGVFSLFVATGLNVTGAHATPQMLAVAALENPQSLQCEDGMCAVELSAMCLQKNRRFPGTQSIYHPHNPDSIQLVFTDSHGVEHRLIADDYAAIRSKRTFTAVTVRIAEETLRELGAKDATIIVASDTTLVPAPIPFDPFPLTDSEIAETSGPMRLLASGWLSGNDEHTTTARLLKKMLNGFAGDNADSSLWQSATGLDSTPTEPGAVQAKSILDTCIARQESQPSGSVRRCMETRHDAVMYQMNKEYWNAINTGS